MSILFIEPIITREFLNTLDFNFFNESEYKAFSEVKHPWPLIAYKTIQLLGKTFESIIILDGDEAELYIEGYDKGVVEYCKNVKEL